MRVETTPLGASARPHDEETTGMLDVAISQVTTPRWELPQELERLAEHGFASLAMWRSKVSDTGVAAAGAALAAAGARASSLHWAGGFTGSDGRSFAESVADAVEAVETAAILGGAARGTRPPVVVLHSGCRGGHTLSHATRLLHEALAALVPIARREGVVLAIQPLRPAAAPGCSFVSTLAAALALVGACDDPTIGLALDLWHFGDDPELPELLSRLAPATALVQIADRCDPATTTVDRLPAGHGTLPLERLVTALVHHGYRGDFEFDPVGETVEVLGYAGVLRETRLVADAWQAALATGAVAGGEFRNVLVAEDIASGDAAPTGHFRRGGSATGSRRSQASSQTVSRG